MSMNCKEGYRTALRQTERDREIDNDRMLDRDRQTEVDEQRQIETVPQYKCMSVMNYREGYRTALRQRERDREIDKDRVLDRYRKTEVYEQRQTETAPQYKCMSVMNCREGYRPALRQKGCILVPANLNINKVDKFSYFSSSKVCPGSSDPT